MKKGFPVFLSLSLLLTLGGCAQAFEPAADAATVEDADTSADGAATTDYAEVVDLPTDNKEILGHDDALEQTEKEDVEEQIDDAGDEAGDDAQEVDSVVSGETNMVTSTLERLQWIRENHNQDPADLRAKVGEYLSPDEDGLSFIEDPSGELYGFEEDLTEGCSVWCAVRDYKVSVDASSVLAPQGNQKYDAENVINGSKENAWVEGVNGNGIGESITITKSYDVDCASIVPDEECIFFYEICFVNGLARNEKTWKANGRVKSLKFYYNGQEQGTIELEDTMKPQYVSLSGLNLAAKNNKESVFTFEIADVYPGDKYEDTAITGIEIGFDSPNH